MDMLSKRLLRVTSFLTEIIIYLLAAFLRISVDPDCQKTFFLCSQNRKKPMRSNAVDRLAVIKIALVFHRLRTCSLLCRLRNDTACPEYLSQGLTHRCSFAQSFCNDIPCTCESILHRSNLIRDISASFYRRISHSHLPHPVCQWFQSCFLGNGSASAALRLVRKIYILKFTCINTRVNLRLEFIGQCTCLSYRCKHRFLTFFHLSKDIRPMAYLSNRHLIQSAGLLFSVPADERNSSTLLKKRSTVLHLPHLHIQSGSNMPYIYIFHIKPIYQ